MPAIQITTVHVAYETYYHCTRYHHRAVPLYRLEICLTYSKRGGVAAAGQISSRHSLASILEGLALLIVRTTSSSRQAMAGWQPSVSINVSAFKPNLETSPDSAVDYLNNSFTLDISREQTRL